MMVAGLVPHDLDVGGADFGSGYPAGLHNHGPDVGDRHPDGNCIRQKISLAVHLDGATARVVKCLPQRRNLRRTANLETVVNRPGSPPASAISSGMLTNRSRIAPSATLKRCLPSWGLLPCGKRRRDPYQHSFDRVIGVHQQSASGR